MIGSRTRSRELALQALFVHDVVREDPVHAVDETLAAAEAGAPVRVYARRLVDGVVERLDEIDHLVAAAADNWDLERLATVDRNVIRLAVYEMIAEPEVPTKVAINEAIELAKRFSTAQSGGFVNGILDRVRKDLGLPAVSEGGAGVEHG